MAIAIIGAMDEEIELLNSYIKNAKEHVIAKHKIVEGQIDGVDIILAKSGIGKVCAASITAILLSNFDVSYVINTGSAGALDEKLDVGDVVFSNKVAHHDVDLTAFGYKKGQLPSYEQYFIASSHLIELAKDAAKELDGIKVHQGDVVSGDQFIADKKKSLAFKETFTEALVCEMESASIAQVCTDFETEFLIIRSVSDKADGNSHLSFDEFLPIASKNSAALVRALINKI